MPLNRSASTRPIIDFTMILTSSSQPVIALVIDNKFTATKIFSVSLYLRTYKTRVADYSAFGNTQVIPPNLADAGVRMSREDREKTRVKNQSRISPSGNWSENVIAQGPRDRRVPSRILANLGSNGKYENCSKRSGFPIFECRIGARQITFENKRGASRLHLDATRFRYRE